MQGTHARDLWLEYCPEINKNAVPNKMGRWEEPIGGTLYVGTLGTHGRENIWRDPCEGPVYDPCEGPVRGTCGWKIVQKLIKMQYQIRWTRWRNPLEGLVGGTHWRDPWEGPMDSIPCHFLIQKRVSTNKERNSYCGISSEKEFPLLFPM